jgi:antitoxin VapB
MTEVAKLLKIGRIQAVRLPAAYSFEGREVFFRKDSETGEVILSRRPESWDGLVEAIKAGGVPDDFLSATERDQAPASPVRLSPEDGADV